MLNEYELLLCLRSLLLHKSNINSMKGGRDAVACSSWWHQGAGLEEACCEHELSRRGLPERPLQAQDLQGPDLHFEVRPQHLHEVAAVLRAHREDQR